MPNVINIANANADRYLWELRGAYSGLRIWDPDFAIQRDPHIYEKMLRDPTIRQCLGQRLRAIAGGNYNVIPPEDATEEEEQAAKVCKRLLSEIKQFQAARVSLARFVWEGTRHATVDGRRVFREIGDEVPREWWVPTAVRDLNKRRVRVWKENGRILRKIERITESGERSDRAYEFPADRVISAVYDDEESRLGFGRGLGDSCYWFFFAKWKLIEEGLAAFEKWMQGIPVVKADVAQLGDTTQTSQQVRDDLITAFKNARAQGVIAIGKEDEVEILHGSGTEAAETMKWLMFFDDGIRQLLTGSKLPSGGGESTTGSLARAEVEADTTEGVYQLDSEMLDEAITDGLVRSVWNRNIENLRELGIEDARMPRFTSADDPREDHKLNADIIVAGLGAGIRFKADEVYEKLGMSKPTEEDESEGNIIEGQAAMAGLPGFGEDPGDPRQDGSRKNGESYTPDVDGAERGVRRN